MTQQAEFRATRKIARIKGMLDELVAHPQNYDTIKLAVEIYEIITEVPDEALPSRKQKILRYFCEKCESYHWVYSNIGNEHRDYKA